MPQMKIGRASGAGAAIYPEPGTSTPVFGPYFGQGWRGAYLSPPIGPDPWGHRYLVNTVFLAMASDTPPPVPGQITGGWSNDTFCISAGPNGQYETAFGGNPTNSSDLGYPITCRLNSAGGTNWIEYVHPQRSDPNSGLVYYLELSDNLFPSAWTNAGYTIVGTGPLPAEPGTSEPGNIDPMIETGERLSGRGLEQR